jgi:hypothetical protein
MTLEKSLCSHRWGYPIIDFGKNQVRTCCRTVHVSPPVEQLNTLGTEFFLNNDYQKQRRLEMLQGARHDSCQQCWALEDNGIQSAREFRLPPGWVSKDTGTEGRWWTDASDIDKNLSEDSIIRHIYTNEQIQIKDINYSSSILNSDMPYMLEVNLSNYCDMNCLYCSPYFSTTWLNKNSDIWLEHVHVSDPNKQHPDISVEELKKRLQPNPSQQFEEAFWVWLKSVFFKNKYHGFRIGIIGGEPTSNPMLPSFLDNLCSVLEDIPIENRPNNSYWSEGKPIEIHKPLLWFVTNLNTNNNYWNKFLDRLPRLCELFMVEITASLESIEQRGEYIRSGLHWDRTEIHMRELASLDYPDMEIGFQTSINCLNVSGMPDFIRFCKDLNDTYSRPIMIKPNIVTDPSMFNPIILDPSYSEYLDEAIELLLAANAYESTDFYGRWTTYAKFLGSIRDNIANNIGANESSWTGAGNRLSSREVSMAQLYKFCTAIDQKRGMQFENVFPEMIEFWNKCKEEANK